MFEYLYILAFLFGKYSAIATYLFALNGPSGRSRLYSCFTFLAIIRDLTAQVLITSCYFQMNAGSPRYGGGCEGGSSVYPVVGSAMGHHTGSGPMGASMATSGGFYPSCVPPPVGPWTPPGSDGAAFSQTHNPSTHSLSYDPYAAATFAVYAQPYGTANG